MHIKILGTGCPKCNALTEAVKAVVDENEIPCKIEKVTDLNEITEYGVMMTPAIVVDEEVKVSGRIPSREELEEMFGELT